MSAHPARERALLDEVCRVFEHIEATMHPRQPTSDLAAIARAAPGESIAVDPGTFELLSLIRRIWASSGQRFDPCLPEQPGRLGDLVLVAPCHVQRLGPPVALDLGGIAKGFAIDQAIETLQAGGCAEGLVNVGGDVRVFGRTRHAIQVRIGNTVQAQVMLENAALAVSEPKSGTSPSEHRGFYSPLTGQQVPARPVAVRAATAVIADALTKCAIVCPPAVVRQLLSKYGAQVVDLQASGALSCNACAPRTLR